MNDWAAGYSKATILTFDMDYLYEFISRYVALSDEELEAIQEKVKHNIYAKGEIITDKDSVAQYLHLIKLGVLRTYYALNKKEVTVEITKEGEVASSWSSFYSQTPSRFVIKALQPVVTISISKEDIIELSKQYDSIRHFFEIVISRIIAQKEQRQIELLLHHAKERVIRFLKYNDELSNRIPQKYLASFLGVEPATFSRMKSEFLTKQRSHENKL